jgi:hypothetical protein
MQTPPQLLKVESDPGEHFSLPFSNGTCTGRFKTVNGQGWRLAVGGLGD